MKLNTFFKLLLIVVNSDLAVLFVKTVPVLAVRNRKPIPDTYIVLFNEGSPTLRIKEHLKWVSELHCRSDLESVKLGERPTRNGYFEGVKHEFVVDGSVVGYLVHLHGSSIRLIEEAEEIESIKPDFKYQLFDLSAPTNSQEVIQAQRIVTVAPAEQYFSPWGLSRISHRSPLPFFPPYSYNYKSSPPPGFVVDVYVIDTGIYTAHHDFSSRAFQSTTVPLNESAEDGVGHGTHVAGTIIGTTYGVAKSARVFGVKVVRWECDGTSTFKGSAINMSLGIDFSPSLNRISEAAVQAGVHVVVASGNEDDDACSYSPSSAPSVITVGASNSKDERAPFSNWGNCTDIFAPGVGVWSASIGLPWNAALGEGTSMATPHFAGLVAYFLGLWKDPDLVTPKAVKEFVVNVETRGALRDVPEGTQNVLAFNAEEGSDMI